MAMNPYLEDPSQQAAPEPEMDVASQLMQKLDYIIQLLEGALQGEEEEEG